MSVLCQSASGRQVTVRVQARTDSEACRKTLAQLDPAEGWLALVVL